jgi:cysteine desulfurase
LYFDN